MVHQYQLNGYNIVLDSCSGSIHAVDEVAYDIIALYDTHTPEEIVRLICDKYAGREDVTEADVRECIADVEELVKEGKLFSPDTFAPLAGTFKERSGDVVKALCLHVSHTCNLNCSFSTLRAYCTSRLTTSQFISGSPPKKSTSRLVRLPECSIRKSSARLPTS